MPTLAHLILRTAACLTPFSTLLAIDANGDGMSDVWQRRYGVTSAEGSMDFNGTGLTNVQKSVAGLDPRAANAAFKTGISALAPGQIMIEWASVPGKRYKIQTSTDLQVWMDFIPEFATNSDGSFVGTGSNLSAIDYNATVRRYYRVAVIQSADSDTDGLDDYEEFLLRTNPTAADTDSDGLTDLQEFQGFMVNGQPVYTDPTNADSDGDGVSDGVEVASGKNPTDASDGFPPTPQQRAMNVRMQIRGTWPNYSGNPPAIPAILLAIDSVASLDQTSVNTATAVPGAAYNGGTGTSIPDRTITRGVEYPFTLSFAGAVGVWPTVVGRVSASLNNPNSTNFDRGNLIIYQAGKGYYYSNEDGFVWSDSTYQATGASSIVNVVEQQLEARNFNSGRLWSVIFDLDIDSLNARGSDLPTRSLAEEDAEELIAKRVPVNLDDDNHNGIPDANESQVIGERSLIPVILEVSPQSLEWDKIKIKVTTDGNTAEFRLWHLNKADDTKTAANELVPGTVYSAAQLGLGQILPSGGKQTTLKFFIEGLAVTNGNRYLEARFIFNGGTGDRELFKDKVLFTVVPEIEIVPDPGSFTRPVYPGQELVPQQVGNTGDIVRSNRGATGEKHFVSPKAPGGFAVVRTMIAPAGTAFGDVYKWDTVVGEPVVGDDASWKVSRTTPGKYTVRVLRKSDNSEADRFNIWIIWASGTITQDPTTSFTRGVADTIGGGSSPAARFAMSNDILMRFDIQPSSLVLIANDIPDLQGTNDFSVPVPGADLTSPSPPGNKLLVGGATRKWDISRRFQFVVVNPTSIPKSKFIRGSERALQGPIPNGIQVPFPSDALIGNDDPDNSDEDNNPYMAYAGGIPQLAHGVGQVASADRVQLVMPDAGGTDGAAVELNFFAQEFLRLQIGSGWYLVSDPIPWKMLMRTRFQGGTFIDDPTTPSTYLRGN